VVIASEKLLIRWQQTQQKLERFFMVDRELWLNNETRSFEKALKRGKLTVSVLSIANVVTLVIATVFFLMNRNQTPIKETPMNATDPTRIAQAIQASFYVSPTGNDNNPGTMEQPFRTIGRAQTAARAINNNMTGDIVVYLRGGTFPIAEPLNFNTSDSGTNGHNVIYRVYADETPIISGGTAVTGWTPVPDRPGVYQAHLNRTTKLRSLFVNGVRASMTSKLIMGQGGYGTFTITGTEPWALTGGTAVEGILFKNTDVSRYANPDDVELVQLSQMWVQLIIGVRDIITESDHTAVLLQQPYGAIAYSLAWDCGIHPTRAFTIQNAYELLISPGQFYFNKATQTLYYYANGEDMATATVIAPASQGLIRIIGDSTSNRVTHLEFIGLTFSYDDWLLQDVAGSKGYVGVQSAGLYTKYRSDGNWHVNHYDIVDLPQATIEVRNADSLLFQGNAFIHLGSAMGISLSNDVRNSTVNGNLFQDNLGNAVNLGHPQHYQIGDGPLYPAGVEGVTFNVVVKNSVVRASSLGFAQLEYISGFFTDSVTISHNDLRDSPYGAIANGWWWGNSQIPASTVSKNNTISYNKIVNTGTVLPDDGGAIYVLGVQPDSVISYNYVVNGTRGIYTDDGSQNWYIHHNVIEKPRGSWLNIWTPSIQNEVIDSNYTTQDNALNNGTNIRVTNTSVQQSAPPWDDAAQSIINNAGLEPEWQYLLTGMQD
jgi:hypothetical protein